MKINNKRPGLVHFQKTKIASNELERRPSVNIYQRHCNRLLNENKMHIGCTQCDQIGQFIALWATF